MSGLKYNIVADVQSVGDVSPYTGEWIEIDSSYLHSNPRNVSPYTGEWIEISISIILSHSASVSPYTGEWIEI